MRQAGRDLNIKTTSDSMEQSQQMQE